MDADEAKMLEEERAALRGKVEKYNRALRRGDEVAVMHEKLLPEVKRLFGRSSAQYFDRKGALPYVKNGAVPWPVTRAGSQALTMQRWVWSLGVGVLTFVYLMGEQTFPEASLILRILCAAIPFGATFFGIFPAVASWWRLAPKDVAQRHQDFQEYQDIQRALIEAEPVEQAARSREAAATRRQRLEGH